MWKITAERERVGYKWSALGVLSPVSVSLAYNSSFPCAVCSLWILDDGPAAALASRCPRKIGMMSVCYGSVYRRWLLSKMRMLLWLTVAEVSVIRWWIPAGATVQQTKLLTLWQPGGPSFLTRPPTVFLPSLWWVWFCSALLLFWDKGSLSSPGCPGTCYINQAGLELMRSAWLVHMPPRPAVGFIFATEFWYIEKSWPVLSRLCLSFQLSRPVPHAWL